MLGAIFQLQQGQIGQERSARWSLILIHGPKGQGVGLQGPRGQGAALQGPRGSRGRPAGSKGVKG